MDNPHSDLSYWFWHANDRGIPDIRQLSLVYTSDLFWWQDAIWNLISKYYMETLDLSWSNRGESFEMVCNEIDKILDEASEKMTWLSLKR